MDKAIDPYVDHIRRLFPGVRLHLRAVAPRAKAEGGTLVADADLAITFRGRTTTLHVELKRTHLGTTVVQALVGALGDRARRWILFAPYIGRPLAEFLERHGLNYLDLRGNCHLVVGEHLRAHVEGQRGNTTARPKGTRPAGVRALFALLAAPDLLPAPGRTIARVAGTMHPTALAAVRRLEQAGALVHDRRQRRWIPGGLRIAFERWVDEYATILRPTLVVGTYRTPDPGPPDLDRRVADIAAGGGGVWLGGAAAAFRVAPHHRGDRTVVHVECDVDRLLRALRAVPDPKGTLLLLKLPEGQHWAKGTTPHTVHPLCVYAEMLQGADDRMVEAAEIFRKKALGAYA